MKIDRFTKVILTVIAVNLTFQTLKDIEIIPKAYAEQPKFEKELLSNKNYGLVPLNADGSINVKLNYGEEINVNISSINGYSAFYTNWEGKNILIGTHNE